MDYYLRPPPSGFDNFLRSFSYDYLYCGHKKHIIKLSCRYIKSDFNNFLYLLRWRKSVCNSSWQPQMHHSDDEKIASWPSKNSNSRIRNKMNCKTNYYLLNGSTFTPIQFSKTGLFPKYSDDKNIAGWPSKDAETKWTTKSIIM